MNSIIINSCHGCTHSSCDVTEKEIEVFCNHDKLNKIVGYTDLAHLTTFPIPNECPILIEQRGVGCCERNLAADYREAEESELYGE